LTQRDVLYVPSVVPRFSFVGSRWRGLCGFFKQRYLIVIILSLRVGPPQPNSLYSFPRQIFSFLSGFVVFPMVKLLGPLIFRLPRPLCDQDLFRRGRFPWLIVDFLLRVPSVFLLVVKCVISPFVAAANFPPYLPSLFAACCSGLFHIRCVSRRSSPNPAFSFTRVSHRSTLPTSSALHPARLIPRPPVLPALAHRHSRVRPYSLFRLSIFRVVPTCLWSKPV